MIQKDNAEHYKWGNNCDGWHLVKSREMSVIQERMPPGTFESRHYHEFSNQFFFVLSGEAELELNGIIHNLTSQQGLHVPKGMPHQIKNNGFNALEFIVTSVPISHGDRIEV
ncbi:cupin domain-containing protein [Agaribacter marinus]|uniref:Cupin n=1 Tax=Agaribacter marinus TaxID=1431249 RepID=A0AA37WIU6_9ALTE|nr:cupin domain-containing protein [Agaribacter marinus]GLR72226.1 cupin [Agaribacter marinus]